MGEMGEIRGRERGASRRAPHQSDARGRDRAERPHTPVRIRNLSETGALIEGASLPGGRCPGPVRGDLQVAATIAWSGGGRCGVRFDRPTPVRMDWQAGATRMAAFATSGGSTHSRPRRAPPPPRRPLRRPRAPHPTGGATQPRHQARRRAGLCPAAARNDGRRADRRASSSSTTAARCRASTWRARSSPTSRHPDRRRPAGAVERIGMEDLRARLKRKPMA